MTIPVTLKEFQARFPTEEDCLEYLFRTRYGHEPVCPKCGQVNTLHRLKKLPAYTCNCGHHIHPMAGTPFERTRTALPTWFHVIYLFRASQNGISAKEVQRQTGVTYKTAWRICNEIRKYMGQVDGDKSLGGPRVSSHVVEAERMLFGGRDKIGEHDQSVIIDLAERGGDVLTRVSLDRSADAV